VSDLLVLSLGTTRGLRLHDAQLVALAREAGADVSAVGVRLGAAGVLRRGYPANDLVEALAARRALAGALRRFAPRALIISTTTAALLARCGGLPYAVWLDSPARSNRPGVRNAPLHVIERRRLAEARLVLVLSGRAIDALPRGAAPAVVVCPPLVPPPLAPAPGACGLAPGALGLRQAAARERLAVAYVPDPKAKGLELLARAWELLARVGARGLAGRLGCRGGRLVVCGIAPERARAFLAARGVPVAAGLEFSGMLEPAGFSALLSRARVFVSAAAWEDFGQAPLQALDHGAALVCAPAGGPFPALWIARELEPGFVAPVRTPEALAGALASALDSDEARLAAYRAAAQEHLRPFRHGEQLRRMRELVLPALLGDSGRPEALPA